MTLRDLYRYCTDKAELHPELYDEIDEIYRLAETEVEDGESEDHECELAVSDIEDLIKENI
jgi:hypothetical protein